MSNLAIAAAIIIPFCLGMLMLWSIVRRRDRGEGQGE
ncbi:hypothetical protein FHS99_000603 [Sphingomonas prati]|uniref:Uncharacterized protein n=1 Tax=Sphingomonas prati TaxID=1843237 RepID=A0A7W9F0A0_9SPHN|nr:hypothetical protein [Sphingomonas prati]